MHIVACERIAVSSATDYVGVVSEDCNTMMGTLERAPGHSSQSDFLYGDAMGKIPFELFIVGDSDTVV